LIKIPHYNYDHENAVGKFPKNQVDFVILFRGIKFFAYINLLFSFSNYL